MALSESMAAGTPDARCKTGLTYIDANTKPRNPKGLGLTPYNFPRHSALK
jgi:hypothetical protein